MRSSPVVSVVIPSYNSACFVCEAVESVLGQTYRDLDIIVVDDGSNDETAEVLDRFRGRIRYVFQPNQGLSAARNRGIREASGELIAFLDADDVWLPEKLEKQLACLAANPRAALVHSDVIFWDQEPGDKHRKENGRSEFDGPCYERFLVNSRVLPSATVIRRECLAKVGLFDESLRRVEDYDLWFRLARHYELAYVDEALLLYRIHPSSLSRNHLAMRLGELLVVRRALEADPGLAERVGKQAVDDRLFQLLFDIGYHCHDARDPGQARRYLGDALRHRPTDVYTLSLYLANFLPPAWVNWLRWLKAGLG
jgi:glycosyltransferase involved in cell wall biosynthesis